MAFEKKQDEKKSKEEVAMDAGDEFGTISPNDIPDAEIGKVEVAQILEISNFDPDKKVVVTPRLVQTPGGTLTFRDGEKFYTIVDNQPCKLPLSVALQLKEKGYIPAPVNASGKKLLLEVCGKREGTSNRGSLFRSTRSYR